ncbi:MAG TPA: diguanylate cyclase [Pilimelia sp.]|nr:diguanylate cyclase [Pilimelia sp.]
MTLRGRLTTAFLAVVLGPVLLGALFVGGAAGAVSAERSAERLDRAASAVGTSVAALCRQLHSSAAAVAVLDPDRRAAAAAQLVTAGLVSAVEVTDPSGRVAFVTPAAPPQPWADCAAAPPPGAAGPQPPSAPGYRALAARVELRDARGAPLGAVRVAQELDAGFVDRLAAASGAAVTLLDGAGAGAAHSTEAPADLAGVLRASRRLGAGPGGPAPPADPTGAPAATVEAGDTGRYVRLAGPTPEQPLPLVLSVPRAAPYGLYALLATATVLAGLLAVAAAWWLARSTTRPLAELARAADRVAGGDLDARVPVRGQDEVARLAGTFNRMTREMQAYVQALTASRDQLRGHLAVLGDALSGTHDLARILQVLLQTALVATGARAGAVLLLDPGAGELVGRCAEGLAGRCPPAPSGDPSGDEPTDPAPSTLRVPLGRGLLGTVAASGVPMRGRLDRDGPQLAASEPRCATYVAVPFGVADPAGPPVALGVLALYDRLGSDEFDDADLSTLRTFAGQAAVAVDNVRVHEEAQRLSLTDPLTGLWNYRYLRESVRREVERASRFGRMLAVLALDLDHFKDVNDTYGHGAGDAVLVEFARRIRAEVREVDLAFRQGGEEFVILLPETDATGAVVVAERLGEAVRGAPVLLDPAGGTDPQPRVAVSVSIGIAVYPHHATTAQQVLDAADGALYAAKAAGRDTYRVAAAGAPPAAEELGVRAGAATPADGLPRAGVPRGTHPPRQGRGR